MKRGWIGKGGERRCEKRGKGEGEGKLWRGRGRNEGESKTEKKSRGSMEDEGKLNEESERDLA